VYHLVKQKSPPNFYSEIWIEANLVILKLPILLWSIEVEGLEIIWYYLQKKKLLRIIASKNAIIYDNCNKKSVMLSTLIKSDFASNPINKKVEQLFSAD